MPPDPARTALHAYPESLGRRPEEIIDDGDTTTRIFRLRLLIDELGKIIGQGYRLSEAEADAWAACVAEQLAQDGVWLYDAEGDRLVLGTGPILGAYVTPDESHQARSGAEETTAMMQGLTEFLGMDPGTDTNQER